MSDATKQVVAGVDKSPASRGALWWAVHEARLRRCELTIVHAPSTTEPWPEQARAVVDDAVEYARHVAAGVPVTGVVGDEAAGRELCRRSRAAALVVVASRGLGGFTGLLLGSVSGYVATHAHCPVLVVHNGQNWAGPDQADISRRPVTVGIGPYRERDATHYEVVEFAFTEAAQRGVHLVAVRAWHPPAPPWRSDVRPMVADVAELETAERLDLTEALLPWRDKFPDVPVRQRVLPTGAAAALVNAAAEAQLVVVGAHHRAAEGLWLGSVCQQVLHHAPSPVAVVRPSRP